MHDKRKRLVKERNLRIRGGNYQSVTQGDDTQDRVAILALPYRCR